MVSIIILSYNTCDLTLRCLRSVTKQLRNFPHEIIVLDNASNDDSVNEIKTEFPQVKLIASKENLGFAKGCNLASEKAKGEYLLFLNSDVELFENSPEKMLRVFRSFPDVGVVGGMLQNKDGSLQRSYAPFYSLPRVFVMLFGGDKAEMRFTTNEVRKVDWVSGGCMMIATDVFRAIKGFDPKFFMYVEDMELCYRVERAGKAVYIDPSSIVTHVGQGSSDKSFAIINIYHGLSYFYKKHKNTLQYRVAVLLLRVKAYLVILLGIVTQKHAQVKTYQQALKQI